MEVKRLHIFPIDSGKASWYSNLEPTWEIKEHKTASGRRRALCTQTLPTYTFSLEFPALTDEEMQTLLDFHAARRGSFEPFYYKDPLHHRFEDRELEKQADGTYHCYINKGELLETAPYVDNVTVKVDGEINTDYEITDGCIAFRSGNVEGKVTVSYDYYYQVTFGSSIVFTEIFTNVHKVSLTLVTAR